MDKKTRKEIKKLLDGFDSKNLSEVTKKRWTYVAEDFLDFIDEKNIKFERVDPEIVKSYLSNKRKSGIIGNTLKTLFYTLKSCFRVWGKKSIFEELEDYVPRSSEPERPYFTVDETKQMLQAGRDYYVQRGDFTGLRDVVMVFISADTGSRRIQLQRLNREHFTDLKTLKIPPSFKGGRWTERKLRKETVKYLEKYIKLRADKLGGDLVKSALFIDKSKKRISPEAMNYGFNKIKAKAGIDKKTGFHGFRRSKTTRLHKGGLSEIEITRIMGWKEGSKEPHIYAQLDQDEIQNKAVDADELMSEKEDDSNEQGGKDV